MIYVLTNLQYISLQSIQEELLIETWNWELYILFLMFFCWTLISFVKTLASRSFNYDIFTYVTHEIRISIYCNDEWILNLFILAFWIRQFFCKGNVKQPFWRLDKAKLTSTLKQNSNFTQFILTIFLSFSCWIVNGTRSFLFSSGKAKNS